MRRQIHCVKNPHAGQEGEPGCRYNFTQMRKTIPGGMKVAEFLRRYWQKRPLFVPKALPGWSQAFDRRALEALAAREDVESRLVRFAGRKWTLDHGPFSRRELRALPERGWSLLVQGVDLLSLRNAAMLSIFDFIPRARLDDIMVSFAPPGAGVGPHFDSYDVFLVQGHGTRRWRISSQKDLSLIPGAPLRILSRFVPEQEWIVEPGDMLYLPPHIAHEGVAISDSITISVGFRAPSAQELAVGYLEYLQDATDRKGMYADADLATQRHPGEIGRAMLDRMARMLSGLSLSRSNLIGFAGTSLTEPKPHVVFARVDTPPTPARFAREAQRRGLVLSPASRMLFCGSRFFINGEEMEVEPAHRSAMRTLADTRFLVQSSVTPGIASAIHPWFCAGYVLLAEGTDDG